MLGNTYSNGSWFHEISFEIDRNGKPRLYHDKYTPVQFATDLRKYVSGTDFIKIAIALDRSDSSNHKVRLYVDGSCVETIEKQEERLAQLSKDGQLAEFAQATYGHARFLIEEIGQVQYHQRWDYLNFAALCCLRIVDCPKRKCTFDKTLYDNIKDVLKQLYLLIDESR